MSIEEQPTWCLQRMINLHVHLESAYFVEIENFFAKSTVDEGKN